jgi:hypothetical protein
MAVRWMPARITSVRAPNILSAKPLRPISGTWWPLISSSVAPYRRTRIARPPCTPILSQKNIAKVSKLPSHHVVGTFLVDACNAIKIFVDRQNMSVSMQRDVFGAQQQAAIERMEIPFYAVALNRASSF